MGKHKERRDGASSHQGKPSVELRPNLSFRQYSKKGPQSETSFLVFIGFEVVDFLVAERCGKGTSFFQKLLHVCRKAN